MTDFKKELIKIKTENPILFDKIKKIIEFEEKNNINEEEYPWGWLYYQKDIDLTIKELNTLLRKHIVRKSTHSTNKYKKYILSDREKIKKAINEIENLDNDDKVSFEIDYEKIYERIDKEIIGNEYVKFILKKFLNKLNSKRDIHLLFYGPPASGKSLIGEILSQEIPEPYCVFISATDMSKAGLFNILYEFRPRLLIIDEIDKIQNKQDLDTLHTLMWGGKIRRTKGDFITDWLELNTKVIGIANDLNRLRESIKSRFLIIEMKEPSKNEFMEICKKTIKSKNYNVSDEIIEYISEKVYEKWKDVRKAVMISGFEPETKEEVDMILKNLK